MGSSAKGQPHEGLFQRTHHKATREHDKELDAPTRMSEVTTALLDNFKDSSSTRESMTPPTLLDPKLSERTRDLSYSLESRETEPSTCKVWLLRTIGLIGMTGMLIQSQVSYSCMQSAGNQTQT